jgi:uncharacterized protein (TIGR00369 family)
VNLDDARDLANKRAPRDNQSSTDTAVKVTQLMTPEWANIFGNVHGGAVLKLVDDTAYVCVARFSGEVCVTASVDRVEFHQPIHIKDLLNLEARIIFVGRSSMEVEIKVYAEDIPTGRVRHTTTCYMTMVALRDGKPTPVPRLICRTREEKALFIQAKMRKEMNRQRDKDAESFLAGLGDLSDHDIEELISGRVSVLSLLKQLSQ